MSFHDEPLQLSGAHHQRDAWEAREGAHLLEDEEVNPNSATD
jgi:hypothetical protein